MITKDGMEGQIQAGLWEKESISRYDSKDICIQIENGWYREFREILHHGEYIRCRIRDIRRFEVFAS